MQEGTQAQENVRGIECKHNEGKEENPSSEGMDKLNFILNKTNESSVYIIKHALNAF